MPRTLLPEEERIKAIEEAIRGRIGGSGSAGDLAALQDIRAKRAQFGLGASGVESGYRQDVQKRLGDVSGANVASPGVAGDFARRQQQAGGGGVEYAFSLLPGSNDEKMALLSKYANEENQALIEGLSSQQRSLKEQAIGKRLEMAKGAEAQALTDVEARQKGYQEAVDQQLNRLLEETGYQAGLARQMVGGNLAERGLTRSTFGEKQIGQVTGAEVAQKAGQRVAAAEAQGGAERALEQTKRNIVRTREGLELNRDLSELQAFEDIGFAFDKENLEYGFQQQLNKMELDARSQNVLGNILGGLFTGLGAIGGFLIGGPPGAAAGAGAASSVTRRR